MILVVCIATVWGCKPEDFGPIVTTGDVSKQLQGTWAVTKVTQIDQDAATKGFPYKELDITNIYAYKDLVLTLQGDGTGTAATFTINPGNAPKLSDINTGTWTLDNAQAPTTMVLKNGATSNTLTFGSYAQLKSGKLYLKRIKKFNGKPVVAYQYEFTKK